MKTVTAQLGRAAVLLAGAAVVATALATTLAQPLAAQAVDVPLEPSRWTIDAPRGEFVEHLGRPSLRLASGSALLKGVQLQDGVIEVDVSAPQSGFAFIFFRAPSETDREDIYLRMGAPGAGDAVQYQPTYGRTGAWQLYHGPGYTAPAVFDPKGWTRLRVEVEGLQARVFVGDSARTPALVVTELKRGAGAGSIGLLEGTAGTGVPGLYFSNFRYTVRPPAAPRPAPPSAVAGAIRRWELSPAVTVDRALVESLPAATRDRRGWVAAEAEPTGLLNIARYRSKPGPRGLVFARTVIESDRDQVRRLAFGYSDDVTLFLNGRPLFAARNGFRARYPSAGGMMTPHDVVFLPLRRGANELVMAVAEEFGGWGLVAQLEDRAGAATRVGVAQQGMSLQGMSLQRGSLPGLPAQGCTATPGSGAAQAPSPERDPAGVIVGAFARHPIVAVGENHRMRESHDFLTALVRDPRLAGVANDIVVEFGNQLYQGIIDRYVAGERVPADSLRLVWRNTTQLFTWESPLYAQFFAAMRAVNATLPRERRYRVLLADPPIDWPAVRTAADFKPVYGSRDPSTMEMIEREVLGRGRNALVIIGGGHLLRRGLTSTPEPRPFESATLGESLTQRHPGKAFIVWPVLGRQSSLFRQVGSWPAPSLAPICGTTIGAASAAVLAEGVTSSRLVDGKLVPVVLRPEDFPPLQEQFDAILYLGAAETRVNAPAASYLDAAYVAELRRRAAILRAAIGSDFTGTIDFLERSARGAAAPAPRR